ncbi:MAG: CaiB/BaiF CoA transferase family protein, partial [Alphaproteobacteria bacterium]
MSGPLAGVRVLDMSTVILGPYISQLMGDWGAEVIKLEPPTGDTTRDIGVNRTPGMSAMFMNLNRNKRSIVLDLAQPAAKEALKKIVKDIDIVVHNFRPKPAAKLGVSYEDLSAINPRLISCTTVGYGSRGRYKDRPAYDDLIQGIGGLAGLIGRYLGGDPKYVPSAVADKTGSLMALSAILAALYQREKTGEGQAVEVPMFETLVSFLMVEHLTGPAFEPPKGAPGYVRQMSPNRRPFRTKDGFVSALPYTDRNWRDFFTIAGRPEVADDPLFKNVSARTENTAALYGLLAELMEARTSAEWLADFERLDIPFAP